MLHSFERISERNLRYITSLLLHSFYGHHVSSTDDKYVRISEAALTGAAEVGTPGSQVVDFFPARKLSFFCLLYSSFVPPCSVLQLKAPSLSVKYIPAWLPGMAFKRHALRVRRDVEGMKNMLFDVAMKYRVSLPHPDIH
jgi:hypothetical protein